MNFLKRILLPLVFDALIAALKELSINTVSKVDDQLVATVEENKEELLAEMLKRL